MLLFALLVLAWLCLMAFAAIAAPILWVRQSRLEQKVRALALRSAEIDSVTGREAVLQRPEPGPSVPERKQPSSPTPQAGTRLPEEPERAPAAAQPPASSTTHFGAGAAQRRVDQAPLPKSPRRDTPLSDVPSLEELIGVRLYIWVGALALFLAGAFLVKYGIDQGWITPGVRVAIAILLGTSLVMAAEWMRPSTALATHGLSSAGVGVLFAGFYAATSLYELIPASAGFLLMGLTGLTAVGLSLRHGVLVGVIGLLGGYLTPLLVQAEPSGSEAVLTLYVLLLFATVVAASRERSWWPVAAMAMLGNLFWAATITGGGDGPSNVFWGNLLAAASALAYIAWAPKPRVPLEAHLRPGPSADAQTGGGGPIGPGLDLGRAFADAAALLAAVAIAGVALNGASTTLWPWLFLAALGSAAIALGHARSEHEALPWAAAAATALFVFRWTDGAAASGLSPVGAIAAIGLLGGLFALGAYGVMWGARVPWRWAALSSCSAIAFFLVAYAGSIRLALHGASLPIHWGGLATVLATLATAGVALYASRGPRDGHTNATVGVLAAGATAFLALAVPLSVGREWFAVAWSLELAALAWLAHRTGFSSLRWPIWPLGALVAADLLLPDLTPGPWGSLPILNWLLYTYGIPIVSFAVAALYAHRADDRLQANALSWGALTFGFALIGLQIRHAFTETVLATWPHAPFVHGTSYGIAWLAYGLGLHHASDRWRDPNLRRAGVAGISLGLATVVLVSVGAANPLWNGVSVGSVPVLNWLAYAYGLPALLAFWAGRRLRGEGPAGYRLAQICMASSLGLVFVLATLTVRQIFHGARLDVGALTTAENYAYSLAWVLLGSTLLVIGVQTGSRLARWASLPIMLLTVSKVFLFDIAAINDLFRVLSFLGLGLSLVALGWVYQRFVFAGRPA